MMKNQPTTVALSQFLAEAKAMGQYWWNMRKLIVLALLLVNGVAALYSFLQKQQYEAEVSFILEEKSAGGGGSLSGLASQFGIDLGGLGAGGSIFSGDNILDILRSRHIVEKVLLSKIDSSKGVSSETLADLYLPQLRKKVPAVSYNNVVYPKPMTRLQDSVLYFIFDQIVQKNLVVDRVNKKGSIIKATVVTESETFSKIFSDRLVHETIQLYVDQKTSLSNRNIARLEKRADSLLRILNNKSYQSASLQILDANTAFRSTAVPVELSQREKTISFALYSEVVKNLEASRMSLASQTPIINMLDTAKYPLLNRKKSIVLILAAASALVVFFSVVIAFFFYPSKK
ncbi:Wzz/FepE/Etk N-terminal domain-containing protein [Sediminibacterium sp.]|uniref:Wzz/FepE/Etk N-terminal domain-containing protein n=1 Tax=Sediminibacterium sp. TaxID=1917865 RepID=UPI003F72D96D